MRARPRWPQAPFRLIPIVVASILLAAGFAQRGGSGGALGYGGGMMGGYGAGGMMGGTGVTPTRDWRTAQDLMAKSGAGATVDATNNAVAFSGKRVFIDVIAVQPGKPDTTFEVANLVDPTLRVPRGSVVDVELINMDFGPTMAHGLVITRVPPPYGTMPVAMMGAGGVRPLAARTSEDLQTAAYAVGSYTFRAARPGTYYYLCQVPGHAQQGMYGTFIVE